MAAEEIARTLRGVGGVTHRQEMFEPHLSLTVHC